MKRSKNRLKLVKNICVHNKGEETHEKMGDMKFFILLFVILKLAKSNGKPKKKSKTRERKSVLERRKIEEDLEDMINYYYLYLETIIL